MYGNRGADGYISPDALERRLRFIPDRWEKGFSKQVQAWGSRAHFMQVRVLWFMQHWFKRCRDETDTSSCVEQNPTTNATYEGCDDELTGSRRALIS